MRSHTNRLLVIVFSIFLLINANAQTKPDKDKGLEYLKANLSFLASDELEGREATTRAEKIASLFIAGELNKYGAKPFGDDGAYFQNFPVSVKSFAGRSNLQIISKDSPIETLLPGDDFFLTKTNMPDQKYSGIEANVVFAGYGISSQESGYDDYKNLDVNGKYLLLLRGVPEKDGESIFSEEETKRIENRSYKLNLAMEHDAAGIIFLPDKMTKRYWRYIKMRANSPSIDLADENDVEESTIPVAILSDDAAETFLENEKYSFGEIENMSSENKTIPSFELNKKVKLNYKPSSLIKYSRNIIAIIEGNDKSLKNQFVTISAHYDHLGVRGDDIYNGADDDGSGTVAILEVARRLSQLNNNKRSILIIFHAAEEKGLLGSKYLTDNSEFMNNVVANINIDMVGRESDDSIFCIGSKKLSTEMYNLVREANKETVNFHLDYKYDDPNDPNRYYYRSDHYNYAKHGIPIVFFYDHMTDDYHRPTDTVEKIDFNKIEKISELTTDLALRISNLDHKLTVDRKEKHEEVISR